MRHATIAGRAAADSWPWVMRQAGRPDLVPLPMTSVCFLSPHAPPSLPYVQVQQWIDAAHKDPSMVKAPWLLLLETDYVWVKPLLVRRKWGREC